MDNEEIFRYIDEHSQDFVQELVKLVKQPSVSARGEGVHKCAEIVNTMLQKAGFSTQSIPEEGGNPVIYGELTSKRSSKTLLFYNHYDVQPPEPLEEWRYGAFSGQIDEGKVYGRGASDNKGNLVSRIKAVEAFLRTAGEVPVNVKFVVEGEEEIGSPHFAPIVQRHKKLFSNDGTIWEFGGTNYEGQPEIYLGLKGVLSVELRAQNASRDVHSARAPLVPNPAWRLVWALNTLKNDEEDILVDGFHDDVKRPSDEELQLLGEIPLEEERLKETLGLKEFLKERTGIEAKKALLLSPTCTINGFLAGYTGSGSKTVLPKEAMVKLDFRLVPNQRSEDIFKKVVSHLEKQGLGDIEVRWQGSTEPTRTPVTHKFVNTVRNAAERVYEKRAVIYPTSAGSGPMHLFRELLGSPVVAAGCSHVDSKTHAPNENLRIASFISGTKFMAAIMNDFSQD